jgi:hypothetical protein
MTTNFKYTGLTNVEILKQISDKIVADKRFDNFRESAIAQTILEIFSGVTDITNYYIERQAQENFFETLKKKSTAIGLSRNLGYDVTRAIPATTTISIKLAGDLSAVVSVGSKLQIPIYTQFTYNDLDFILKAGFTYTFTAADVSEIGALHAAYEKVISLDDAGDPITLVQGTIKEYVIAGTTNPQIGQTFQKYKLPDSTFSNVYGAADYEDYNVTKVWVGEEKSEATQYLINRRSLINDDTIQGIIDEEIVKCCVIRTAIDETVELMFGNAKIADLGATIDTGSPTTTYDNVWVQYLSTNGSLANKTGVIDEALTNSTSIIIGTTNISDKVSFIFLSNIYDGADLEDTDSIVNNAPAIYYTLDRLVSKSDYSTYLRTLTSPVNIKNALVWGEQEECLARGVPAIIELFNVILFSCVGSLYNLDGEIETATYSVKTINNNLESAILDIIPISGSYDIDEDDYLAQYYFNIYTKHNVASQLKDYTNSRIMTVLDLLAKRSQVTAKHIYVSPILQNFNIVGNVYINQLSDKAYLNRRINNEIYKFLDTHNDYNVPVYKSNIIQILEDFTGVDHADINFQPKIEMPSTALDINRRTFFYPVAGEYAPVVAYKYPPPDAAEVNTIYACIRTSLTDFFNIDFDGDYEYTWKQFINYTRTLTADTAQDYTKGAYNEAKGRYDYQDNNSGYTNINLINERLYLTEIIKDMYDDLVALLGVSSTYLTKFQDSQGFQTVISDIRKDLTWLIRQNMIDSHGNINAEYTSIVNQYGVSNNTYLRGGYSLGSEISKFDLSSLIYLYK